MIAMAEPMILRANALTTLDRLKSFLCIPADEEDSERDAALTQLINAASAWLETKLGEENMEQLITLMEQLSQALDTLWEEDAGERRNEWTAKKERQS